MSPTAWVCVAVSLLPLSVGCGGNRQSSDAQQPEWELANPVVPLPTSPLGIAGRLTDLPQPPTPERVRLGRWLFYDARLSADESVACATCHRPENAFSQDEPVATGIRGQKGSRKSPSFINLAWAPKPHFFWDGRAKTLEEQALGPIANPVEMGNTHTAMIQRLEGITAYRKYFQEAFGTPEITQERVAKAIADYERTRMSGNSAWDRWARNNDQAAVSADVKKGSELFFGEAMCVQCHTGDNFTDGEFHNLGVGWDPVVGRFRDEGRFVVTKVATDRGAFKTPTLREVTKHPPFMHDGSLKTLRDVMDHYNEGGTKNPFLDAKMRPLNLTDDEIDALIALMEALEGEGYQEKAPTAFPR